MKHTIPHSNHKIKKIKKHQKLQKHQTNYQPMIITC